MLVVCAQLHFPDISQVHLLLSISSVELLVQDTLSTHFGLQVSYLACTPSHHPFSSWQPEFSF